MARIVKHFTKFIFPFIYDKDKISPCNAHITTKKGATLNLFEPFSLNTESLRDGLESLLSKDGGASKIADCYKLNVNCRREFNLPPHQDGKLSFLSRQGEEREFEIAIREVNLYFFESLVGFAELECEYYSESIDDYIHVNYFISEAKSDKNLFVSYEKVWNAETQTSSENKITFTVEDLLTSIFDRISIAEDAVEFYYRKTKPMIYSYLLLNEKPEDMKELLYNIAKNYKLSYKFDDSCTNIKTLASFENSSWASSLNGVINVSFLTGDSITDNFFSKDFAVKMRNTYFFLYLNVVHQRNAVTKIMGDMGHLDRLEHDYYVMEEQLRLARKYEMESINLKFRAFFKCPSTIDHINNYYDMIYDTYQIGAFYDHFSSDMKNLQGICSKYVERIKERDDRFKKIKAAKTEIFISIFGAIVAAVTLFNNSWSLVEKVMGHSISFINPGILIMCATLLSSFITITANVSKKISEIKELEKQLMTETKDNLVEDDKDRRHKGRLIAKNNRKKRKDK